MRRKKIVLIILGVVLFLGVGGLLFNNYLNTSKVKDFIQAQLPKNIELEYDKISTNVLLGNFSLQDAHFELKDKGIKIDVGELKLKGLSYSQLLTSDTIAIDVSEIKNAYVQVDKSQIDSTKIPPKKDQKALVLKLKKFEVDFSGIEIKDKHSNLLAKLNTTHLGLRDLMVHSQPKEDEQDFEFALKGIHSDSLVIRLSETQDLQIGKVEIDDSKFILSNSELALKDKGIQVGFDKLELFGENLGHIFTRDTIDFDTCRISQAKIKINNAKRQTQASREKVEAANKVIRIGKFLIKKTDIDILDKKGKPKLNFKNTNALFDQIKIRTAPEGDENHLTYNFISLNAQDLSAAMSDLHTFAIEDINVNDAKATLKKVSIHPNFSRSAFQKHIKEEKDVIDLEVPQVTVENYDYSFDSEQNYIKAQKIDLNAPNLSIYRDKTKPDQSGRKPLYSEMLRQLKLELAIDKINISDAKLTYEERVSSSRKAGKIFFTQLNGNIENLYNKIPAKDKVNIHLNANFMGHAPTHIDWSFHVLQPADRFNIKGSVKNLNANALDDFLVPNMKAKMDGRVQLTTFNFSGGDIRSTGRMEMDYDDLKVEILNHKNEKKGFWSVIANFFVNKNKKKDQKEADKVVSVERDQTKSFFNYFWLSLKDGIKQNVMKFQGSNKKEDKE